MGDFTIFYQNGGLFMHFITVTGAVALAAVLLHGRIQRMGAQDRDMLRVADRVAAIGVAIGLTGMLFGCFDLFMALTMIDPATIDAVRLMQAAARGASLAPIPLAWGFVCAVPIWIATTIRGARPLPQAKPI